MKQAALAERKGWQLSKQGNVGDKKALADLGMVVGKVNSSLQAHFEKVGQTMAKEWSEKGWIKRGISFININNNFY